MTKTFLAALLADRWPFASRWEQGQLRASRRGLNGTGDTLNNIPFTKQSLQAMLERLGVNVRGQTLRTGNVAAVMVTASLPAFATQGTRMDITVSALGDSKSLQGGTLLVTPLLGADGLRGRSGFGRHRRLPGRGRGSASISDPGPRGRKMRLSRPVRPYELPFSAAATNFSATPFMQ
jgi:hypothetical protein